MKPSRGLRSGLRAPLVLIGLSIVGAQSAGCGGTADDAIIGFPDGGGDGEDAGGQERATGQEAGGEGGGAGGDAAKGDEGGQGEGDGEAEGAGADASADAGADASAGAGADAGADAGAGADASADAGADAGADASAGADAGADAAPIVDGGPSMDTGADVSGGDAGEDAATNWDARAEGGGGEDAADGSSGEDATVGPDAGPQPDAGSDGGTSSGAGPDSGSGGEAGCTCTTSVAHATSTCSAPCAFVCDANYVRNVGACVPPATRPIGPLTGNAVSTRTPTLTWALPTGFTSAHLDVCMDRACTTVLQSEDVTGTSATLGSKLPVGMNYWRLTTLDGTSPTLLVSATWQFAVSGTRSAPVMRSWPQFADIEGDGYADFVLLTSTTVQELQGSTMGIQSVIESSWAPSGGASLFQGGDVNGDGMSDVVAMDSDGIEVLLGSANGFPTAPSYSVSAPNGAVVGTVVGDVDGDGYADLVGLSYVSGTVGVFEFNGSRNGFAQTPEVTFDLPTGATSTAANTPPGAMGDINGDGYADVLITDAGYGGSVGRVWIYLGGANGLPSSPSYTLHAPAGATGFGFNGNYVNGPSVGGTVTTDVDADGYPDLFVQALGTTVYEYAGSSSGYPAAPSVTMSFSSDWEFAGGGDVDGDGYGDVIFATNSATEVFQGSTTGLPATPSQTLSVGNISGVSGNDPQGVRVVALLGDVNGDALSDFAVSVLLAGASPVINLPAVYEGSGAIPQAPAFVYAGENATQIW